jgi:hypothetical protein
MTIKSVDEEGQFNTFTDDDNHYHVQVFSLSADTSTATPRPPMGIVISRHDSSP